LQVEGKDQADEQEAKARYAEQAEAVPSVDVTMLSHCSVGRPATHVHHPCTVAQPAKTACTRVTRTFITTAGSSRTQLLGENEGQ